MFGKHFASMYEGSLVGAGAVVFAVMGYVIAKQVPDREHGSVVTLNPKLLGPILGESQDEVTEAIAKLCAPDPQSTTPTKEGRRLVKLGQFEYQVVNGAKYRAIRNEEERRAQNREAKRKEREKQKSAATGQARQPKTSAQLKAEDEAHAGVQDAVRNLDDLQRDIDLANQPWKTTPAAE